jgi:hypothetical protein
LVQFEGVPDAPSSPKYQRLEKRNEKCFFNPVPNFYTIHTLWFVKFREMTSGLKKKKPKNITEALGFLFCAEWVRVGESG